MRNKLSSTLAYLALSYGGLSAQEPDQKDWKVTNSRFFEVDSGIRGVPGFVIRGRGQPIISGACPSSVFIDSINKEFDSGKHVPWKELERPEKPYDRLLHDRLLHDYIVLGTIGLGCLVFFNSLNGFLADREDKKRRRIESIFRY